MNQCFEIVRFRVNPETAAEFVRQRQHADAALATFRGFLGSELVEGPDQAWTLLVRWASRADVEAAQAVTLAPPGLPAVSAWIALAREVVSFETVDVRVTDRSDANLSIALRFANEGLGKADMKVFEELLASDIVVTTGLSPNEPIRGRDAYKQVFASFADAWPVTAFTIDDSFAAGDKVLIRFTATTVFKKDYYGVKATNLIVPLKEMHLYTLRAGKIVENVVGAVNLPFEFTMYPALQVAVLGGLEVAQ